MPDLPTGTVSFLFTDIEGSTKFAQDFPVAMSTLLARQNGIVYQAIESHNGVVYQIIDTVLHAAFFSACDALLAALAQRMLLREP